MTAARAFIFVAVAYSQITGNHIADNSGGVLLTDETGPTHNNLVADNVVTGNSSDCGITVPGHNPAALNATAFRSPRSLACTTTSSGATR